jgi:hypothetical protein
LEAAWGWHSIADPLSDAGFTVHLAHPLGAAGYRNRRVNNDERDAVLLADLLRMESLPEAWITPPELHELWELARYRHKLCELRSGLKSQIHAVAGVFVGRGDASTSRVGRDGEAGTDHETRLRPGALGRSRSRRPLPGWTRH